MITLPGIKRWLVSYDKAIPKALSSARTVVNGDSEDRRTEILTFARRQLVTEFPKLRHSLTTNDQLEARITQLNTGKKRNDDDYLWVVLPTWKQTIPGGGDAIRTDTAPVPTQPATALPQPVAPAVNQPAEQSVLLQAVDLLIKKQVDTDALLMLQLEATQQTQQKFDTLIGIFTEVADHLKNGVKIAKQKPAGQSQTPLLSVPPADPKKRRLPAPSDTITVARRADYCFGEEWERVTEVPRTENEENWLMVFRELMQHRNARPNFIVFGWYATEYQLHQIFHRLGVDEITWIHTYDLGARAVDAVNRITPTAGKFAAIMQYVGKASGHCHKLAATSCKAQGITHYTMRGHNIETDAFAYHMISKVYKRTYDDLRFNQASQVDAPRNGHVLETIAG